MQQRRLYGGQDFSSIVRAFFVVVTMACGSSFAQTASTVVERSDVAARVDSRIERRRGIEHPKPDFQEISRLKREFRESVKTQPAVALPIMNVEDKKIAQVALREERARLREDLKTQRHVSDQKQRIEEARQEAGRRIAEAKEQ